MSPTQLYRGSPPYGPPIEVDEVDLITIRRRVVQIYLGRHSAEFDVVADADQLVGLAVALLATQDPKVVVSKLPVALLAAAYAQGESPVERTQPLPQVVA